MQWCSLWASSAQPGCGTICAPGDLPLNAKLLFCLCGGAPELASFVQDFLGPVNFLAGLILAVAFATSTLLFCLCCCIEDADRYYDPDLL